MHEEGDMVQYSFIHALIFGKGRILQAGDVFMDYAYHAES